MLRSWASGKKAQLNTSSHSLSANDEENALNEAMSAATLIMNDDLEGAEAGLQHGNSAFHKLGRGLISFLRAALGFEKDVMREAQERLASAEAQASSDQKRIVKDPQAFRSSIYEPGMEFALTYAECLLMGAVVGILNESLTEALKGFYNMRKAFITLSGIVDAEMKYKQRQAGSSKSSVGLSMTQPPPNTIGSQAKPGTVASIAKEAQSTDASDWEVVPKIEALDVDDEGDAFEDADEIHEDLGTPQAYLGKIEINGVAKDLAHLHTTEERTEPSLKLALPGTEKIAASNMESPAKQTPAQQPSTEAPTSHAASESDATDAQLEATDITHPMDVYISSGANLCFGMLLLMLSMIPPAFGRLLNVIGFKGDRERGLRLLWESSKYSNINGAMAGLCVLLFYNGLIGFCDIIPDASPNASEDAIENIEGFPLHRLEALLEKMRGNYPKSGLWLMEEARMLAAKKQIDKAIPLLSGELTSPLKQVNALSVFERALQAMYSHRYQLCADSFVECTKLNNWSHALYYYLAGCAHVELYRLAMRSDDTATAKTEAALAEELLGKVHVHAGKRKFMSKQMPFETYCLRKLSKWQERAEEWDVPLTEAVGVSPLEEMIAHWNGYKKMDSKMLEGSLEALAWSENEKFNKRWSEESLDEKCILYVLRAASFRCLGRHEEAKALLLNEVICHDKHLFKGGSKDDWTDPYAHYEMAVNLWTERTHRGEPGEGNEHNRKLVREAQEWISKVQAWDGYILDARLGMRVSAASDTLRKWRIAYHD